MIKYDKFILFHQYKWRNEITIYFLEVTQPMTKQKQRKYLHHTSTSITGGASGINKHFVEAIQNIHTTVENILSADGQKSKISAFWFTFRLDSEEKFGVLPVIVQTAGTITDTIDLASNIEDVNLDSCIDDVFGYQNLARVTKVARRIPSQDGSAAGGREHGLEFTVQVPGNFIQILNKEVETERLQNLYMVLYGFLADNDQVLHIKTTTEIDFVGVRKTIILR